MEKEENLDLFAKRSPNEEPDYEEKTALEAYVEDKIASGEFKPLPVGFPKRFGVGQHLSTQDPSLIAHYPTRRSVLDRKAHQIRPGRFLRKYFPAMTDDEIREAACLVSGHYRLIFVSTFEEMYRYYRQLDNDGIVDSCMSKETDGGGHNWPGGYHPLEVYHNSDVGLAVMLDFNERARARALYNKRNQNFPMIYGEWERMRTLLEAAGFTHGPLDGAKINRIQVDGDRGRLLVPYIDHVRLLNRTEAQSTNVDVYDDYLQISVTGKYEASAYHTGVISVTYIAFHCECCGEGIMSDEEAYGFEGFYYVYCDYCYRNETVEVNRSRYSHTRIPKSELESVGLVVGYDSYTDPERLVYFDNEEVAEALLFYKALGAENQDIQFYRAHAFVKYAKDPENFMLKVIIDEEEQYCLWSYIENTLGIENIYLDLHSGDFRVGLPGNPGLPLLEVPIKVTHDSVYGIISRGLYDHIRSLAEGRLPNALAADPLAADPLAADPLAADPQPISLADYSRLITQQGQTVAQYISVTDINPSDWRPDFHF